MIVAGEPKRAIHWLTKASTHRSASTASSGTASNHLLVLSMMVNRYLNPSREVGRGPTRSTWMWEKRCLGISIGWMAVAGCVVTFALAQS